MKLQPISTSWIAQAGSQRMFLSCPVGELLYDGTRGPGKTDALLMKFAKYTGMGFGQYWRGIIFRETYKQLTDVIAKSKRRFYGVFPGIKYNESSFTWKWPTGEELLLRHMAKPSDYWNYHGHEYPYIGWEELTNWIDLECYEMMKACNRSSFPGVGMPRIYASTCNPFGKGHQAVKNYFIIPAPRGTIIRDQSSPNGRVAIHGNVRENVALMLADPTYIQKLDAITDIHRRKAWRYGSWDIAVGSMFDDLWNTDVHWIEPFPIPAGWTIDRSFDWGSSKPFSVGWWAVSDGSPAIMRDGTMKTYPRGSYFRIGEWYGWNGERNKGLRMTARSIAEGIRLREESMGIAARVIPGPADTSIFDEEDGHSQAAEMAEKGITWLRAHKTKGSRKQGWQRIRQLLDNAADDVLEHPGMWIFNTCAQFRITVPGLPRDDKDPDDVDSDAEDHIGDETRYEVLRKPLTATQEEMY